MLKHCKLYDGINIYRFNSPIETGIFDLKFAFNDISKEYLEENLRINGFEIKYEENKICFIKKLIKDSIVYGLGENVGGVNKKGKKYSCWNTDDFFHTPDKESLYSSHPFLIINENENKNEKFLGLLIDYTGRIDFDIGFTKLDEMKIVVHSINFDIYFFNGINEVDIISKFLNIAGTPYLPPKWAFGFQQSRWSYPDSKKVEEIANKFRENEIPCDAIYLDIDYMDDFKVFTIDNKKFPDFSKFSQKLLNKGFKLIPIIDPGVKIEKKYSVCKEMKKNKFFCRKKNKKPFIGAAWPGRVYFPDFFYPEVRKWWGKKYVDLIENGASGFWNDMNEPAIFFTPQRVKEVKKLAKKNKVKNCWDFFCFKDNFSSLSNRNEYYEEFYHYDGKNFINHKELHNVYGYFMAKSVVDEFNKAYPNRRLFLLSRSSYIGMHKFATIWMGDNQSWWEHLLLNIHMLINLNIVGFFYTGADICGFGGNVSNELAIRWMQLGVYNPLFRNHSALGTRDQEPFAFDEKTNEILKNIIKFRYSLIPYIYSEFIKSLINKRPFICPISFFHKDDFSKNIEDQFYFGTSILVCPIYKPNTNYRTIYLPETFLKVSYKNLDDIKFEIYEKGFHNIEFNLDENVFFVKEDSLIILSQPMNYVDEKPIEEIFVYGFIKDRIEFTYYLDDGYSNEYKNNVFSSLTFYIEKLKKNISKESSSNVELDTTLDCVNIEDISITIDTNEQPAVPITIKKINFTFVTEDNNIIKKVIGK